LLISFELVIIALRQSLLFMGWALSTSAGAGDVLGDIGHRHIDAAAVMGNWDITGVLVLMAWYSLLNLRVRR